MIRKPPKKGYAISTSENEYLAGNGESTVDVARAKVAYTERKANELLEGALAKYPLAKVVDVTVGMDSKGRVTVNGFPRESLKSRRSIRRSVWGKYGGRCAYCGADVPLRECHMDAFYPSKGLVPENMMPACDFCFLHKKGKTPAQFQAYIQKCLERVRKIREYRCARRYGLIVEPTFPVTFHYMRADVQGPQDSEWKGDDE